jgi:hypothetical protein
MKEVEKVLRLDVALVQRVKGRSESWKPERSDSGKIPHATLIDAMARSLLTHEIDISRVKGSSWYLCEDKRRFHFMYEASPRNV